MTASVAILILIFILPMIASMGGAKWRWKLLANLLALAAIPAFFYQSFWAVGVLWLLSCSAAIKSLRYTHADARTDRLIRTIQEREQTMPATSISPTRFAITDRSAKYVAFFGFWGGIACAIALLFSLLH